MLRSELETVLSVCKNWEKQTKLMLEYSYYTLMAIRDVSTYLAVYEDGSIKHKNAFEIDKEIYKNPSMRIVPIALEKYFVHGIPIADTIKNHRDIFDFCLMTRCTKHFDPYYHTIEKGQIIKRKLSKTVRYFASKKGGFLFKKEVNTGKLTGVLTGQTITLFNKKYDVPFEEYNIDYLYYIKECNKIIEAITPSVEQLSLF